MNLDRNTSEFYTKTSRFTQAIELHETFINFHNTGIGECETEEATAFIACISIHDHIFESGVGLGVGGCKISYLLLSIATCLLTICCCICTTSVSPIPVTDKLVT